MYLPISDMSFPCLLAVFVAAASPCLGQATFNPKNIGDGNSNYSLGVPLDLSKLLGNRGFAMSPGDADFDGLGSMLHVLYDLHDNFP
jgi:alpha-L-fucosidase